MTQGPSLYENHYKERKEGRREEEKKEKQEEKEGEEEEAEAAEAEVAAEAEAVNEGFLESRHHWSELGFRQILWHLD